VLSVNVLREAYPEGFNLAKGKGTSTRMLILPNFEDKHLHDRTTVAQTCGFQALAGKRTKL
jgi:hypothetical protein